MRVSWRLLCCLRGKHERSRGLAYQEAGSIRRSVCRYCGTAMEKTLAGWKSIKKEQPPV
jgi:hypothetical protein